MNLYSHAFRIAAALVFVAVFGAGSLSARSALEGRCGTTPAGEGPARVASVAPPRPVYPNSVGSAHFLVHYPALGDAAYAQAVSEAAEKGYRVLIDTLGYAAPPSDGVQGGDGRTDIYVRSVGEMGGVWGVTWSENPAVTAYPNSYTAWASVVDTMSLVRLQAVTVHEYFHVVHLGYDRDEFAGFYEMISTWSEERVYDDNNIYYEVLPDFFDEPSKSLFGHIYSNVVWSLYLTEKYDDGLLRDILHECGVVAGPNVVAAHDAALANSAGTTFREELVDFTQWNYQTGARDDGMHYREGASYPEVAVEKRSECMPFSTYMTAHPMGTFGANYFFFDGNGASDPLRITVNPEYFGQSILAVTRFKGSQRLTETRTYPLMTLVDSVTVDDWQECDSVLAVMHGLQNPTDVWVSARFVPQAPPVASWVLLLDRDACRRPFDGIADSFTTRDGQERPWAEALATLGINYVQSDSIPDDLSGCAGMFVTGAWDEVGPNLSDEELSRIMTFMDAGGHVYLESRRFGNWGDPVASGGTATEMAFWGYFGTGFQEGDTLTTGNVMEWHTDGFSQLGSHDFSYDAFAPPDDRVGSLVPSTADTLAVDGSGLVRMTLATGAGGSRRIHSTVLLGGSTGMGGSSREEFVTAVIDLFGTIVPALAVVRMHVEAGDGDVRIEGELAGYDGEPLALFRADGDGAAIVEIEHRVTHLGGSWLFSANDRIFGPATYNLILLSPSGVEERLLWSQTVSPGTPARPLAFPAIYPNPARAGVRLVVESDRARAVDVSVYDVAGRRIHGAVYRIGAGSSTLPLDDGAISGVPAGMYFVRVSAGSLRFDRKLVILR